MHCSEIEREIATPDGRVAPEALARHLAVCAPCAAFDSASRRLDRILATTRPAEPTTADFERTWAGVTAIVGAESIGEEVPVVLRLEPATVAPLRGRGRWVAGLGLGLAAAAAILLTVRPFGANPVHAPRQGPTEPAPPPFLAMVETYEFDQGSTAIIRIGPDSPTIEYREPVDVSETETVWAANDIWNHMETF